MGSLSEEVFQTLKDQILSGEFLNGEELTELLVAKKLGVSRTPVREAIHQLESEGLVRLKPNKGAVVTGITTEDIQDIYAMRARLEGLCARWAAKKRSEQELEELEEIVFLSEYHEKKGHYEQVYELDGKFHKLLYKASHSRMMEHSLCDYHQYVKRVRKHTVMEPSRAGKCNNEHHKIVDAIREQDEELAEKLATKHIMNSIQNLSRYDLETLQGPEL